MRFMRGSSDLWTMVAVRRRRFCLTVFLVRMWLWKARFLLSLPEAVVLIRFVAPDLDFIFGIMLIYWIFSSIFSWERFWERGWCASFFLPSWATFQLLPILQARLQTRAILLFRDLCRWCSFLLYYYFCKYKRESIIQD